MPVGHGAGEPGVRPHHSTWHIVFQGWDSSKGMEGACCCGKKICVVHASCMGMSGNPLFSVIISSLVA